MIKNNTLEITNCLNINRIENAFLLRTLQRENAQEIKTVGGSVAIYERQSGVYLFSLRNSGDFSQLLQRLEHDFSIFYVSNSDYVDEIRTEVKTRAEIEAVNYIQYVLESAQYHALSTEICEGIKIVPLDHSWTDFILSQYKNEEFRNADYINYCIDSSPSFGALCGNEKIGFAMIHKDGELGPVVISKNARGGGIGRILVNHITSEYTKMADIGCGFVLPNNEASKKIVLANCFVAAEKQISWIYLK